MSASLLRIRRRRRLAAALRWLAIALIVLAAGAAIFALLTG